MGKFSGWPRKRKSPEKTRPLQPGLSGARLLCDEEHVAVEVEPQTGQVPQGAEGHGVYFSEGAPVAATTAEGTHSRGTAAIVVIEVESASGWWRTKASLAKKFGRARTWHSDGKNVECKVVSINEKSGSRLLVCQGAVK